jgi:hypothetical protein
MHSQHRSENVHQLFSKNTLQLAALFIKYFLNPTVVAKLVPEIVGLHLHFWVLYILSDIISDRFHF